MRVRDGRAPQARFGIAENFAWLPPTARSAGLESSQLDFSVDTAAAKVFEGSGAPDVVITTPARVGG